MHVCIRLFISFSLFLILSFLRYILCASHDSFNITPTATFAAVFEGRPSHLHGCVVVPAAALPPPNGEKANSIDSMI